jgi:hypothetical protein
MDHTDTTAVDVRRTIDREVDILLSAVALVAAGGAPSTTVAGLRLTEAVVDIVRPIAADRGVELEPLWTADEDLGDVRVRRIDRTR